MKKKSVPIGVSEFRKVMEEDYYYVDKTMLIEDLLKKKAEVTLFTRPRRFGKTLNMTMLREFFDITKDTKKLFENLYICNSVYINELNQYPTLFFSFRDSKGDKLSLIQDIKIQIMGEYQKYLFIGEQLEGYKKQRYKDIYEELGKERDENLGYTQKSIFFLSEIVSNYYQKPVILLIDEYDTPMIYSYTEGYYDELRIFFTSLYASALKDNPFLKQGILTGIQRIAKENIFSGLNNPDVITVLDDEYNAYFGMTPDEVKKLLNYYDLELNQTVKNMYNGYHFGNQEIYNPWSILNYAKKRKLNSFWVNTSSNALIRQCILEADEEFKIDFETLISEKKLDITYDVDTSFYELKNMTTLWGLLLNSGYITVIDEIDQRSGTISIPNAEVRSEFERIMATYTGI